MLTSDISPVDLALRRLIKATTEVEKAQAALTKEDGDVDTPLNAAALMLEGLIGSLRIALMTQPPPRQAEERIPIPPTRKKSYRDRARRSPWDDPPNRRKTPEPVKQAREEARKLLAPPRVDLTRSGIWVPECEGFRRMEICLIQFEREITTAIAARLPAQLKSLKHVEFLRRLERGGFKIQLAEETWEYLHNSGDMTITTASKGTWKMLDPPTGPLGPSLVIQEVDKSITVTEVKEEIASRNIEIHHMEANNAFENIIHVSRMKWRNPTTNSLEDSRSIRIHLKPELHEGIAKQGAIAIVGYRLCHVREFEPPKKKCLNCGRLGFHTANEYRFDPWCRHCHGKHRSDDRSAKCAESERAEPPLRKAGPSDWCCNAIENTRRKNATS